MFFRNLTLFRFSPQVAADLARLPEALADHRLRPCGPLEMFTRGFVPPVGRGEQADLTHTVKHCTAFTVGGEDKLLPAAVLNDELYRRVQKIAEEEGRKVGGRERKRIKEDLLTELLPRAFVCTSRSGGYVDTAGGWLVLDTASRKTAEQMVTQLREALGSFPAVPLAPEEGPRVLMTDWLANGKLPAGLALGDECELRDPATSTGAVAITRRQDLDAEEVKEHLRNGKQVFKLGLTFDDRITFVLGEDLAIRKLKFLDVVMDELGDSQQDAHAEMDASFALLTLELERLLSKLAEWFGLPRPADAGEYVPLDHASSSIAAAATHLAGDGPDPLYRSAVELVRLNGKASISGVQRHHQIGYNRAARLIEAMEAAGVVSVPGRDGVRTVLQPSPL